MYSLGKLPSTLHLLILWSQGLLFLSVPSVSSMPLKQTALGFEVLWCCGILSLFA